MTSMNQSTLETIDINNEDYISFPYSKKVIDLMRMTASKLEQRYIEC